MLKLEKKKEQVHLLVRDKDRIWNRTFIFAFCLALFLHLLSLCLFHVHPIRLSGKEIFLPAAQVNATIPVLANLGKTHLTDQFEPQQRFPEIPLIELSFPPSFETACNPHLDPPEKKHTRIRVSGPLSESAYINAYIPNHQLFNEIYDVRVDNFSGCIIWYRSIKDKPNAIAESVLKKIRFAGTAMDGFTSGWIEIEVV